MSNVIEFKPAAEVSGPKMSPETATWVNKFIALNANRHGDHGPMTMDVLLKLMFEDVAAAMREGGDSWQGCHMAILLLEHGYRVGDAD